jgi:hypothetical protein
MFPFRVGPRTVGAVIAVCALALALVAVRRAGGRPDVLRGRARLLAVGAALVAVPLFAGQALARYDYFVTRERDARRIIDALDAYYERELLYPDTLQELVEAGDLESVPEPSIGFGFLYDGSFRYQSFGTSFLLEFPAPRWVECAYTPPYDEEDEEDAEGDGAPGADDAADAELDEAWSCPSRPPELW